MPENLIDSGLQESTAAPSGNLIDQGLSGSGNLIDSGLASSPGNGQTAPKPLSDPNQPWYSKAWDWANTPLTESLLGLPTERAGAGGFERAGEHILAGFSSPLSLALTAATFGTGGLIESAGANLLKESGLFTAAEIADVAKGSEAAVQASKDLKSLDPVITEALKDGGHDLDLLRRAKVASGPLDNTSEFASDAFQGIEGKPGLLEKRGFDATEREALAKSADTINKATQGFSPVTDAVKAAGVDPAVWKRGQDTLYNAGLTERDLLGGSALERGAFQLIKKANPAMPVATAVKAAKIGQALLNAGFTLQQFQTASQMSPRFLDALKDGDYDKAAEYGTEAVAGGVLGVFGASHALESAGELASPVLDLQSRLKPSDQNLALNRMLGEKDQGVEFGVAQARNLDKTFREALGHQDPNKNAPFQLKSEVKAKQDLESASVLHQIVTGGDQAKAADWYNQLAESDGRDDRVLTPSITAYHGTPNDFQGPPRVDGLGAHFTLDKSLAQQFTDNSKLGRVVEANLNIRNPLRVEDFGGSHTNAEDVIKDFVKQGVLPDTFLKDVDSRIYRRSEEIVGPLGDRQGPELSKARNQAFEQANTEELERVKSYLKSKGYDGLVYDNKVEGHGDSYVAFDSNQIKPNANPNETTDPNVLASQTPTIGSGSENFSKQPAAYKDLILNSLKRVANGELSVRETDAAKLIKSHLDKNFEIGNAAGLLGEDSYVKDYMQRLYKDNNPETNGIVDASRRGNFSTNVTMAQRRVFDSHIQALLKSPKQIVLDPVGLTAEGRRATLEAAANKKLVADFLNRGNKMSDGRPVAVLSGTGRVVQGSDGENPATLVNPTQVRDIRIADNEIQNLVKTGDLQRFLGDGNIKEISPKVHSGNIAAALDKLEKQQGTTENLPMDENGDSVRQKNIQLLRDVQAGKRPYTDLKEYNDALKPSYVYDPQDYISVNNGSLRGWNFVSNDTSGNNILVRSDIRLHPEIAEYLKNRLGLEKSGVSSNPIGKALLGAGGAIKKNILSLSPFHLAQEALRAVMVGINPLHVDGPDIETGAKVDPADPNSPTKISKMVEQGFTPGVDYQGLQDHSEGLSGGAGLLRRIPGVGKPIANSLDWYQNFLFKRYIPGLKARAGELMFDRYKDAHPDWSIDKVAKAAAIHTNDTFGGQNWKALGRSATTQDWGRLLALAPDWLESEMRSAARLFNKDEGGLGRAQMLKMTMALWGTSRVLNMLTTGQPHNEAPFGLAVQNKEGKETVYSIRTLPTDILHAASDPVGFVKGRLSPTAHMGTELVTGRDNFGRKLTPGDMAVDIFRGMAPIPVQALGQAVSGTGPEIGNIGQAVKAGGGTVQTYSTPAQKLAAELAANHNEDGPIDQASMARHRTIMNMEDQVRGGELSLPDIYRMYASGQLHEDDLKKITQNVQKTRELSPDMAALYGRVSRLPAPEFLQVYDDMSPHEKAALLPLTQQIRKKYITKQMKNLRPEERLQDPTFVRLMNMIPNESPF